MIKESLFVIIGRNLRRIRKEKGMSIERLSLISAVNKNYISDLERGKFCPSLAKLQDIARALGVEPYELIKPDHIDDAIESKRIDERK